MICDSLGNGSVIQIMSMSKDLTCKTGVTDVDAVRFPDVVMLNGIPRSFGARCSSVVRAFAHWISPSWWTH